MEEAQRADDEELHDDPRHQQQPGGHGGPRGPGRSTPREHRERREGHRDADEQREAGQLDALPGEAVHDRLAHVDGAVGEAHGAADGRQGDGCGGHRQPPVPHEPVVRAPAGASTGRWAVGIAATAYSTMTAVTMPNMPLSSSTWGRMWQCQTQAPGLSSLTSTEYRSPGATFTTSAT